MQFVQQSIVNANDLNASHIQVLAQAYLMRTDSDGELKARIRQLANCCFLGMPLPIEGNPEVSFQENISVFDENVYIGESGDKTQLILVNQLPQKNFTFEQCQQAKTENKTYVTDITDTLKWKDDYMKHFVYTRRIKKGPQTFGEDETKAIQFEVQFFDDFDPNMPLQEKYDKAFGYYKWIECRDPTFGNVPHPEDSGRMGIVILKGTGRRDKQFELATVDIFRSLKKVTLNNDDVSVYMTYDAVADGNLLKPGDIGTVEERQNRAAQVKAAASSSAALTSDFARMSLRGAGRGLGLRPQELAEVLELAS